MAYFSRLTDIVSCNLSSLLARNENDLTFLRNLVGEMKEGVAGAQRCVATASANVARLESEIAEQRSAVGDWVGRAQKALKLNEDGQARLALERKHEVEDLIAGLEHQLQAAIGTRDHLITMLNAVQARLADGLRRLEEIQSGGEVSIEAVTIAQAVYSRPQEARQSRVDSELEELRRQLLAE